MKLRKIVSSIVLVASLFCPANVWLCASTAWAAASNAREKVTTDNLGKTIDYLDSKGRLQRSIRHDKFGPELGRETLTVYSYDSQGRMLSREITNKLMRRVEYYDQQGRVNKGVEDDQYGVEWGRHKKISDYEYDAQGTLVKNVETSQLEIAKNIFDKRGQVIESRHKRNVGVGAMRDTLIKTTYDPKTALPLKQVEENAYGRVETNEFDPVTLLPAQQMAKYNFGLVATRETRIQYEWNTRTGLPKQRTESNQYGVTQTFFDSAAEGAYGIPVKSVSNNNFGLKNARHIETVLETDQLTGLPKRAKSVNKNETNETQYDTLNKGLYGVPVKIATWRNFGITAKRYSETDVEVNSWTGLTKKTVEHFRKPPKMATSQ